MTSPVTREEKHACATRELAHRVRFFPRWVSEGRMTPGQMEHEIRCMTAIVADYAPAPEPDLLSLGSRDAQA